MMKIDRKQLLNDLQDFAFQGDGVIIGSPGIGKTYVLQQLRQRLKAAGIPHLLLRIDQLGDGTTETLRQELSYESDLIEKLKSIPISGRNAILLFDAFDAARDEQTRKRFLKLIDRAIRELVKWNIVVTVRTYDAKKSQELLDLFGSPDDPEYQSEEMLCRHFTIPPFDENEILQAFDQIGCPKFVYKEGSQDFKYILATPFNLWLLEKILKVSPDLPDFSKVRSEVQLLGLFWERRIESISNNNARLLVLEEIAREMVKQRSLSIRQSDIREALIQTAWNDLLSDEILTKVSSTGQRVAFSHNILFDYAISVLLIDDEPQHLENFITEDPSRPLFLRPSLTYFFTRLWYYDDTESFWRAFWHIFPSDQSVHLRLVARLIPTSVIANEAREIEQLTPLLEKLQNGEEIAKDAITRLLQALQTLQIERDTLWINFFDRVSRHLHSDFAWDLANLTLSILDRAGESKSSEIVNACGRIGRRLLKWVWQERETNENDWYDRLGSYWAVPLVAKTYYTDVEKSRALLEKVLILIREDNFPIDFLSMLTEHVDKIWDHDSEFVASTYFTVFTYYDTSDEKIIRGGPILPMATLRHQAYGLCQYKLVRHLPNFLQTSPLTATRTVVQSLNSFIIGTHVIRKLQKGMGLEDLVEDFDFREKSGHFLKDGYISDVERPTSKTIEIADALFEFIVELAKSDDSRLGLLLDVCRDEVVVAFFWKRLLKTASQFPKVFAPHLFELCIAKPIQISLETSYELGLFLGAAAPEFTPEQLRWIEKSILALPKETEDNIKALQLGRDRLLAQLPMSLLATDAAREIREKMERENSVPVNQPHVSFTITSETVTEEKSLQRRGVNLTTPENQELYRFFKPLDEFISNWRNDIPTAGAIRLIFPRLEKAYTTVKSNTKADKEVIDSLWLKLTDCLAILSQVTENCEDSIFTFCRQVLLEGAEQPIPASYLNEQFDSSAYSPYPRHEAASGLLHLSLHHPDSAILDTIEALASDPVPSVRMVTAMELAMVYVKAPDRFWHIMNNRAIHERNRVVQEYLYFTLTRVPVEESENEVKTTDVMEKLLEHTPLPPGKQGLSDPFVDLLMWLALERENSWALKTINNRFFKDPIQYTNILNRAVDEVMRNYVAPKHLKTPDGRERVKRAILWVSKVITIVSNRVKELYIILNDHPNEEIEKQLRDLYAVIDVVITCLYYEIAHETDQSEKPVDQIARKLHNQFYNEVKLLMKQIVDFAQNPEHGMMFASTAHYFMQLLRGFLDCNSKEVLHLAAGVIKSSERFGYNLDSIAVRDIVQFVEIVLADHRNEVRDGEALEDLLNLLDIFAKTGWSDALKLVWRLDEVFR